LFRSRRGARSQRAVSRLFSTPVSANGTGVGTSADAARESVRHALQGTFSRNQSYRLEPVAVQLRPSKEQASESESAQGHRFEEARELFSRPCWLDQRSDVPEQFLAIGWVGDRLYSVIFEVREDEEGEILNLVTLWKSTKEEIRLYEESS